MNKHKTILLTALAAGIGYGGWAVFANYEHGPHAYLMAGIIQALYAFASTLSITHIAHWTCQKCNHGLTGITIGFAASFIIMLAIPLTIHKLAGTPDLWETILPGLIWGSIYLMSYLISVDVKHRSTK